MFTLSKKTAVYFFLFFFELLFFNSAFCAEEIATVDQIEVIKPPPRDIKDILRILDQTKQDRTQLDKAKKVLTISVPNSQDSEVLNHFYYRKASAESILGNSQAALEDLKKVINEYPSKDPILNVDELAEYALLEAFRGNRLLSNEILEKAKSKVPNNYRGRLLGLEANAATNCIVIGDFECANSSLKKLEGYYSSVSNARNVRAEYKLIWQVNYERTRANLFAAEGKYLEAERSLRQGLRLNEQILSMIKDVGKDAIDNETRIVQDATTSLKLMYDIRISMMIDMSSAFLGQRRLIDAEYWARESVALAISKTGVNSFHTTRALLALTRVVSEQGRQSEAVLLAEAALKSAKNSTDYVGSPQIAAARKVLGTALTADGKYLQAEKIFNEMLEGIKTDPQIAARYQTGDLDWALSLMKTGKASQAVAMTTSMLSKASGRLDKSSSRLAIIEAFNAAGLQISGQNSQALSEFKRSIPILMDQSRSDSENASTTVRQTQRMTFVLEEYLSALAQLAKSDASGSAAAEAFQIADFARGSGVQRALTLSAARANITDPQLASLARREQDLQQRINTLSELLTGLLSAPPEQQLPAVQNKIRSDIASFKSQREELKKEIERKFPDYAELVEPKPASVERTQKALRPDEVLVSWYFADNVGYVWAITKDRPVLFAQIPVGRSQVAKEVTQLRKALDPGVATIDEIPPFDIALAHQLYQQILAPVQGALVDKKVLLTVPHAELGQLPLSLLVTKQASQPAKGGSTAFIGYRSVPWLTRDIAVAQVPSVTALTALRALPAGNPNRKNFIGFGDPYFSSEQEKTAQKQAKLAQLSTRGIPLNLRSAPKTSGVSSAELALLPRLPDTSLELIEVSKAMGANEGDIFIHQKASVREVMSTDLSNRKVVMFATHGLVPGELNGLTQPALALSSPEVTGDKDDGLLTMDKVLTLKLDADWVVLSACNTASGEGSGSEAVSGLGRAFFFAGAKALLVSNWPVDSVASRTLMTDLFKKQQKFQDLSKAQLLRQAMLGQIDEGGMKDGANMKYAYAHPLFWAPFVVVGD